MQNSHLLSTVTQLKLEQAVSELNSGRSQRYVCKKYKIPYLAVHYKTSLQNGMVKSKSQGIQLSTVTIDDVSDDDDDDDGNDNSSRTGEESATSESSVESYATEWALMRVTTLIKH